MYKHLHIIKHPVFYTCVLVASALYIAAKFQIALPSWVYSYINDFLCMPIVLALCLAVLRSLKKKKNLYIPIGIVLGLTSYFSLYFEWLMPQVNARYTGDLIDICLYFAGAILYFKFQKRLF